MAILPTRTHSMLDYGMGAVMLTPTVLGFDDARRAHPAGWLMGGLTPEPAAGLATRQRMGPTDAYA